VDQPRISHAIAKTSVVLAALVVATGCGRPSFVVTVTTDRQGLVETELMRDSIFAVDKIAIIDVTGMILNAPAPGLFGGGEHPVSLFLEQSSSTKRTGTAGSKPSSSASTRPAAGSSPRG